MDGFVLHNLEGEILLKKLQNNGIYLNENERINFLFGNLIVDSSKIKKEKFMNLADEEKVLLFLKEKQMTHFRVDGKGKCIEIPVIEKFLDKYYNILKENYSALGYIYHLYTDIMYFTKLFPETFDILNEKKEHTNLLNDAKYVKILKNNEIYPFKDLFVKKGKGSLHYDYTIMNKIILNKYSYAFNSKYFLDKKDLFINPGIEEVDFNNIEENIIKAQKYIDESLSINENTLYLFDENKVFEFLSFVADSFINKHGQIIEKCLSSSSKKLKKECF